MVNKPAQANKNTTNASGPSNPANQGRKRCSREGRSKTKDMFGLSGPVGDLHRVQQLLLNLAQYAAESSPVRR